MFPPHGFDGGPYPQAPGLSPDAWARVRFLEAPVCDGCGAPFEFAGDARCAACLARPFAFGRARSACLYDEHSRALILRFKHGDALEFAELFARWIGRASAELIEGIDAVVPVPLHPFRLISRRYNQAAEIARPLARAAAREYLADALVRARPTASQGGKTASGRRRNVTAAFEVPAARAKQVRGRRILLVDDVMTTGATADACARALLKAGARSVDLATVARVASPKEVSI